MLGGFRKNYLLLSFLAEDLEERELDELVFPEADFAFLLFPQAMVFLLKMLIKLIVYVNN